MAPCLALALATPPQDTGLPPPLPEAPPSPRAGHVSLPVETHESPPTAISAHRGSWAGRHRVPAATVIRLAAVVHDCCELLPFPYRELRAFAREASRRREKDIGPPLSGVTCPCTRQPRAGRAGLRSSPSPT